MRVNTITELKMFIELNHWNTKFCAYWYDGYFTVRADDEIVFRQSYPVHFGYRVGPPEMVVDLAILLGIGSVGNYEDDKAVLAEQPNP